MTPAPLTGDDIREIERQWNDRYLTLSLREKLARKVVPDLLAALSAETARADAAEARTSREALDGNRPLPIDRETLGRFVREAWVLWAREQPSPKPSWLVPFDELSSADKEADCRIGEAVARWTLIHDAARIDAALSAGGNNE